MNKLFLLGASVMLALLIGACQTSETDEDIQVVYRPDDLLDTTRLAERRQRQLATTDSFDVFHDFSFTDRIEESQIGFQHKIVDDAGIAYKLVHYDHGTGMAVADVDGDGHQDIYFVTQVGANELWRNRGDGTFEDFTAHAGAGLDSVVAVGASFADIDNDGDPDLFVSAVREGNFLFENDGTGRFTDISEQAGVKFAGHASGAVFFDYDRDGLLDLFVTNVGQYSTGERVPIRGLTRRDKQQGEYSYYVGYGDSTMGKLIEGREEPNVLYRNAGGNRFVDVTDEMDMAGKGWSGDATIMDVNEDGWLDLYVLNMNGNDEYYENQQGEGFALKTAESFRRSPYGSMGVTTLDYNNDGRMDLYLTDMHSDMWETNRYISPAQEKQRPDRVLPIMQDLGDGTGINIFGNALFRNEGDGDFRDVALDTGTETYWPWGVSSGDLNADGYEDLFVTGSMNYPFRYAVNSVLLNNRGEAFLDSEFILGVEPRKDNETAKLWFELDCSTEEHRICEETGLTGRVDVYGALGSRSSALFDLEGDGDLDIVTNEFNAKPMVLVSNLSQQKPHLNYAKVELVGQASNRDGIGATVRVYADSLTLTKMHDGKSGYLSQSSYPLYFGLGPVDTIDRIEVDWPSGQHQVVEGPIATNQLLTITEEE